MTAACRETCCGATPCMTVSELFERGYRRSRAAPLASEGQRIAGAEDNWAHFSVEVVGAKLVAASFRASSCATLIAYCELIAEMTPGFDAATVSAMTPEELIAALPGVPPQKHDRAVLAIAAFRSSLQAARPDDMDSEPFARSGESGDPVPARPRFPLEFIPGPATDLGSTRDRSVKMPKSARADLGGRTRGRE